jgi:hypothetical protein
MQGSRQRKNLACMAGARFHKIGVRMATRGSGNLPSAFTEHGAIMLASVFNGAVAIQVSMQSGSSS